MGPLTSETVVCICAGVPPTMPTYRTTRLPTCQVWVVENLANVVGRVTEPVTYRTKDERVPATGEQVATPEGDRGPSLRTSNEHLQRLLEIANTIESSPVLGHWPHMRALPDGELLRWAYRELRAHETAAIPADAQVIPGRLGHAEWCPASNLPSCRCGAAEPAFDAFGQPKPCRTALKATVCPKDECAAGEFPHRRGAKGTCIYCGSPMNGKGDV